MGFFTTLSVTRRVQYAALIGLFRSQQFLANWPFDVIGRWMAQFERRISAIISITLTMHRLIFFRLESTRHSPCSSWSAPDKMLVLFSTLWLSCAVFRSQGTLAQCDFVIIFNNISRLSVCLVIHPQSRVRASQGFLSACSPFASPHLVPKSALLRTGRSVGFRSLELISVCGFNRRNN